MAHTFDMTEGLKRLTAAYSEGKLGNQQRKTGGEYVYPDGSMCAVGAMMDEETQKLVADNDHNEEMPSVLFKEGVLRGKTKACERNIIRDLDRLAAAHDVACDLYIDDAKYAYALEAFDNVLNDVKKKYGV